MQVKTKNITTTLEVLKRKLGAEYLVPITITGFTDGVCHHIKQGKRVWQI